MRAEAGAAHSVCLVVPGAIDTLTGGYLYDRRMLEELALAGWKTQVLSLDPGFPLPSEAALAAAKARFDALPDGQRVVIDGLALAGLAPLLPAIVARLDTVALIHHPLADETGIDAGRAAKLGAAEAAALALVPRIVVTSRWTQRQLSDYAVAAERVTVVEPGVEPGVTPGVTPGVEPGVEQGVEPGAEPGVEPGPDRTAASERELSGTLRLLCVATVTPRKGHAVLIEALTRLRDLDWSLVCVGSLVLDRPCADALRAQIDNAGLGDRVTLLGELAPERVRAEFVRADLFVLASWLEGYGMALAEALAHGLPVVSTTAGAIPDTVPGSAARLVAPGDSDALADVLGELMQDRAALARLTRGARAAAGNLPSWADAAATFAAVLARSGPA